MTPSPTAATRFDWRRFLDLAERLAQDRGDEAALRTAISRAHYAAFALARQRLRDDGCWPHGRDPHVRAWSTYRDAGTEACRRIGEKGFNLRDRRRQADYDDELPLDPERSAASAIRLARQIFDLLDRIDPADTCCGQPSAPARTRPT